MKMISNNKISVREMFSKSNHGGIPISLTIVFTNNHFPKTIGKSDDAFEKKRARAVRMKLKLVNNKMINKLK